MNNTKETCDRRSSSSSSSNCDIYRFSLDVAPRRLAELSATLSHDELARARRFYFERDERRFIAGRGLLREILATQLQVKPDGLAFSYGAHGKPAVAPFPWQPTLHFNLAHTGSIGVVAVSGDAEVGVDVEQVRTIPNLIELSPLVFSPDEREEWLALNDAERLRAFFQCWTIKEAFLKAVGKGLSDPLDRIQVRYARDGGSPSIRLVDVDESAWSFHSFAMDGFPMALAVNTRQSCTRLLKWPQH
jgi:4'-phosphopantetheinyl transferase